MKAFAFHTSVLLHHVTIPWVANRFLKFVVKYLGIFINSHLKWSDHVKHLVAKASRTLNYLRHTLFSSPSTVKAIAYKSIVRPILEYASPVWCLHLTKDVSHLESIQRRAARWVCGSKWNPVSHMWNKSSDYCLQELKWSPLHTRRSFFSICLTHDILHNRVAIPFSRHFQIFFNYHQITSTDFIYFTIKHQSLSILFLCKHPLSLEHYSPLHFAAVK